MYQVVSGHESESELEAPSKKHREDTKMKSDDHVTQNVQGN